MLWELEKPFSIEEVEVAPPKAHEVRIKVKYFLHVYLILGLKISESNSEDNQNSLRFLHGHPDSGITFVIKEICKYIKREQTKPKVSRRKEIIKIREEINKIETQKTIETNQ